MNGSLANAARPALGSPLGWGRRVWMGALTVGAMGVMGGYVAGGIPSAQAAVGGEAAPDLARIRARGELRVGVELDRVHFSLVDGRPAGLDVDWAQALAKDLGLTLRFVPVQDRRENFARLRAGQVDLAMGDNPVPEMAAERDLDAVAPGPGEAVLRPCAPIRRTDLVVAVAPERADYLRLAGKSLWASGGTGAWALARSLLREGRVAARIHGTEAGLDADELIARVGRGETPAAVVWRDRLDLERQLAPRGSALIGPTLAAGSRSANSATSTFAPVTSSRPDDCTWIAARCSTLWKPAVGFASSGRRVTRLDSSLSRYSVISRFSRSRSTPHARSTATASWSSVSARSRCSSVAYSWLRSLALARARCRVCSSWRDSMGGINPFQACTAKGADAGGRNPSPG